MALTMTIEGTPRAIQARTVDVIENINGRSSMRVGVYSSDASYTPSVDEHIILYEGADIVFSGYITDTTITYLLLGASIVTTVEAADYSSLAERLVIRGSTGGGITGRDCVDYVVNTKLSYFGVTRDPAMGTGATLGALQYDYMHVSEALDEIARIAAPSGWTWRIDENKVLRAFLPGAVAYPCPFSVVTGDPNVVGDITVKALRSNYANRVILTYGDGSPTPAVVQADNASEQALRGLFEIALQTAGPIDVATAQAMADARVAQLSVAPLQVTFVTRTPGAHAGQTLDIDLPARNLDNVFLINEVQVYDVDGVNVFYRITAVEGATPMTSWRDTYKLWAGSMATARGGVGWGAFTPTTVLFSEDFESGSSLATLGFVGYTGGAVVSSTNTTSEGLNGTTWGVLASASYPVMGHDVPSPGFGARRDGWVEVWTDFSDLQAFGWTFIAATNGDYTNSGSPIFDLYVGTDSGDPTFWVYTGTSPGTPIAQVSNIFTANTESLVRVSWRQSTYSGGTANSDGEIRVRVNGTEVLSATGVIIADAYATTPYEVTRIYTNPCGRVDEIRMGYGQ